MFQINPSIFHDRYIRGVYPEEINEEAAYRIAWAFAKAFKPEQVLLGMDMRGSSVFLARGITKALNEQGIPVVEMGRVPTPMFYYAASAKNYPAGIMVTGSGDAKEFNGFKFFPKDALIEKIKEQALSGEDPVLAAARARGKLLSLALPGSEYVEHEMSSLGDLKIKKMKIAADPGNAMGTVYLEELFRRIPCDPIKVNWDLNGNLPIHEANPQKPETLQQLRAIIKNESADLGIATDGDGDKIVFLDSNGELLAQDYVSGDSPVVKILKVLEKLSSV